MKRIFALLIVTLIPLSAGSRAQDGSGVGAPREKPSWIADAIANAGLTVAKWHADQHQRSKDGPCRGERVDKPEHCAEVIMASVLALLWHFRSGVD